MCKLGPGFCGQSVRSWNVDLCMMVSLHDLDACPWSEDRVLPRVLLKAGACHWVPGKNSQEREGNSRESISRSFISIFHILSLKLLLVYVHVL